MRCTARFERAVFGLGITGALAALVGLGFTLGAGCGPPEESPVMQPGVDCMSCHSNWTVAGTAFASPDAAPETGLQHAEVVVIDDDGHALTLRTNGAGNFYTAEAVTFPIHVHLRYGNDDVTMEHATDSGACNSCHNDPPEEGASGRLFIAAP